VKSAVVTGAARGIGAETVRAFAAEGWSVVAVDRCSDDPRLPYSLGTRAELDTVVADAGRSTPVVPFVANSCDPEALADAFAYAETTFGGVDAVVAVAGAIGGGVPFWEMQYEQHQALVEANLQTVVTAAQVGIPALLRRAPPRNGRFLAVSSAAAHRALPMIATYSAAKAGVEALIRTLAAELDGSGVTANTVRPGSTATPMLDESARLYALESPASFADQQPIRRLIEPVEVARALLWLAGEESGAITGAVVAVDGGLGL
jgi:SDR family mycofactocin-dependent oxidoreductase